MEILILWLDIAGVGIFLILSEIRIELKRMNDREESK